mgnify:CR=1 FL=1
MKINVDKYPVYRSTVMNQIAELDAIVADESIADKEAAFAKVFKF